jgi:hypothetical protein
MPNEAAKETIVLVPSGVIGLGIEARHVRFGIEAGAHVIACDAGSTDSGPAYLSRGVSKASRESVAADFEVLLEAAMDAGIPLLIGSCGTSGCDAGVDWTSEIVAEICRRRGFNPKVALLYSEQAPDRLKHKNAKGRIRPLAPKGPLDDATLDQCDHIVALMGPEPYIRALEEGAQVVLGGRTTDTAVLAAVPLMRGASASLSWHAGKIAECGASCAVNPFDGGVLLTIGADSFVVEPLSTSNRCTTETVSAHMLYENADPFRLVEPGGVLDVSAARYTMLSERAVRVAGARWEAQPYTMKLEGAGLVAFQTIMLVGIQDPRVLGSLEKFSQAMHAHLRGIVDRTLGPDAGDYDISLRLYGWNAVSGGAPPIGTPDPREIGLLFVATASDQAKATRIAKTCNPHFFHFPISRDIEVPTYAYPFSPAEVERGGVYEFLLNHVVETESPHELVRMKWSEMVPTRERDHADA